MTNEYLKMDNVLLYSKLATLPDSLKTEVGDFIDFLSLKRKKKLKSNKPKFGSCKGLFIMKPDFEDPLDDFKEYM